MGNFNKTAEIAGSGRAGTKEICAIPGYRVRVNAACRAAAAAAKDERRRGRGHEPERPTRWKRDPAGYIRLQFRAVRKLRAGLYEFV